MYDVLSPMEMRQCEEFNFATGRVDARLLMQVAGEGCAAEFLNFYSTLSRRGRLVIFAGGGNNGGDGIAAASILADQLPVPVVLGMMTEPEKLTATSRYFFRSLNPRVTVCPACEVALKKNDVIIDALLGIGCREQIREPYRGLIDRINKSKLPVLAIDLPSGLGADCCVRADYTVVIGYFKDVLFTDHGIENAGLLRRVELPLPVKADALLSAAKSAADLYYFIASDKPLARSCHKYQRGSVLICGGSRDYVQAPFLSARSALRSGAGLVRLALPFAAAPGSGTLGVIPVQLPNEQGSLGAASFDALQKMTSKIDAVAAGPGMGRSRSTVEFVRLLLGMDKPLLLDADGIYAASELPELVAQRTAPLLFTPHRGEAVTLAAAWGLDLSGDDSCDALALARATGAVILLKGPRSVTASPDGRVWINTSGTPALATAGSGDCLCGIIAAEMCRHDIFTAAVRGAFLHGLAGELAQQRYGDMGVIADDLPEMTAAARSLIRKNGDIFA